MERKTAMRIVLPLALLLLVSAGIYTLTVGSADPAAIPTETVTSSNLDLGISYVNVTPTVARYHQLETESGALITKVTEGGIADHMQLQPGDIIVDFNGESPGTNTPLLGMMRACHAGSRISLGIITQGVYRQVEYVH